MISILKNQRKFNKFQMNVYNFQVVSEEACGRIADVRIYDTDHNIGRTLASTQLHS